MHLEQCYFIVQHYLAGWYMSLRGRRATGEARLLTCGSSRSMPNGVRWNWLKYTCTRKLSDDARNQTKGETFKDSGRKI